MYGVSDAITSNNCFYVNSISSRKEKERIDKSQWLMLMVNGTWMRKCHALSKFGYLGYLMWSRWCNDTNS